MTSLKTCHKRLKAPKPGSNKVEQLHENSQRLMLGVARPSTRSLLPPRTHIWFCSPKEIDTDMDGVPDNMEAEPTGQDDGLSCALCRAVMESLAVSVLCRRCGRTICNSCCRQAPAPSDNIGCHDVAEECVHEAFEYKNNKVCKGCYTRLSHFRHEAVALHDVKSELHRLREDQTTMLKSLDEMKTLMLEMRNLPHAPAPLVLLDRSNSSPPLLPLTPSALQRTPAAQESAAPPRQASGSKLPPLARSFSSAVGPGLDLPPGWEQAIDAGTATPYYFNRTTRDSSWTAPIGGNPACATAAFQNQTTPASTPAAAAAAGNTEAVVAVAAEATNAAEPRAETEANAVAEQAARAPADATTPREPPPMLPT